MTTPNLQSLVSNRGRCGRPAFIALFAVLSSAIASRADVLYSTIQGATSTGSTQPTYSASLNLNENVNNAGPVGFGDDYTSSSTGLTGAQIGNSSLISTDNYVQLTSLSYYGDLEPGPNGSSVKGSGGTTLYSEGGDVEIRFYDSSGVLDQGATISGPMATSASGTGILTPSAVQGPGLHTITLTNGAYIPASGYFVITPQLAAVNGGHGDSPVGTVGVSFTGYFGAAPTVGTGSGSSFVTRTSDPNNENSSVIYTNSTFSNLSGESPDSAGDSFTYTANPSGTPSTGYYEQVEFDGNGLSTAPEPGAFVMFVFAAAGMCGQRRRSRSPHREVQS